MITNHDLDLIGRAVAETPPRPGPTTAPEGGDDEAEREPAPAR